MKFLSRQNASLIVYGTYEGLGTKVFDYIGLNKPIIYYGVYPSELSEFISRFKNVVVTSDSIELEQGIRRFVHQRIEKLEVVKCEKYSREYQNIRYKNLIDRIVHQAGR